MVPRGEPVSHKMTGLTLSQALELNSDDAASDDDSMDHAPSDDDASENASSGEHAPSDDDASENASSGECHSDGHASEETRSSESSSSVVLMSPRLKVIACRLRYGRAPNACQESSKLRQLQSARVYPVDVPIQLV